MTERAIVAGANVFLVTDVQAAARYYRDALGFEYDRFWGEPPDFCMAWRDGHCVMLSQAPDPADVRSVTTIVPAVWDAYFWVQDADALFAELSARSARIDHAPFEKPYGVKEFVVLDVDDHRLAFGEDLGGT